MLIAALVAASIALPLVVSAIVFARSITQGMERGQQPVPGWGTRMPKTLPFAGTMRDIASMNDAILTAASNQGFDWLEVSKSLDEMQVTWVVADDDIRDDTNGRSWCHVEDPYGRTTADGDAWHVAGWHVGRRVYVVYRPELPLEKLEYDHEATHAIGGDGGHTDPLYWGPDGIEKEALAIYVADKPEREE